MALVDRWIAAAASPFRRRLATEWADLLQDIRLELLECLGRGRWRGDSRLTTYVWSVAGHTCLDAIRRARRRPLHEPVEESAVPPARGPSPLDQVLDLDRSAVLLAVLDRLPAECQKLWRDILAGLSFRQISQRTSVSEPTLRVRAHRCRKKAIAILRGNAAAPPGAPPSGSSHGM